jgi:hypothetical protein
MQCEQHVAAMVLLCGHVTTPQATGQMSGQCVELALNVGSIRSYAWRGVRGWSGAECMVPAMHPNNVTDKTDECMYIPLDRLRDSSSQCDNES